MPPAPRWTRSPIFRAAGVIAIINFFAYVLASAYLGGDAINGKAVDGRYFLSSHGRLTEVTRSVFTYSTWHTYSVWLTHLSLFIAAIIAQSRESKSDASKR